MTIVVTSNHDKTGTDNGRGEQKFKLQKKTEQKPDSKEMGR